MKKLLLFFIVLVVLAGGFYYFSGRQGAPENTENLLGGDQDEHGCIGSAGYTWSEPKQKCVRAWEESIYVSDEQEIQYLLANKYSKPIDDVTVTITKKNDTHLGGSVMFGEKPGPGGLFLAVKEDNNWNIVYDGNGSVDCDKLRNEYGFTDTILSPNFCN